MEMAGCKSEDVRLHRSAVADRAILLLQDLHIPLGAELCCSERSFLTKEEKVERLNEYKQALELEAKGVAERINELEKA